jgi:hypothetical protein
VRGPRRDDRPGRGGRALERLRQWERARGLPEREISPNASAEPAAEPAGSDADCEATSEREDTQGREGS